MPRHDCNDFTVTMTKLGNKGRFANQIFQYAFLRFVGAQHGYKVECPDWVGSFLFGHNDPPPSRDYLAWNQPIGILELHRVTDTVFSYQEAELHEAQVPLNRFGGVNFNGHFQFMSLFKKDPSFFRSLFQPVSHLKETLEAQWRWTEGKTVVAIHLRYDDGGVSQYYEAELRWVHDWLEKIWPNLKNPVLYIATTQPRVRRKFKKYETVLADDVFKDMPDAPFYPDFWAMTQASVLAIANSTFSFAAALLNEKAAAFFRPVLSSACFAAFEPWDAPTTIFETTEKLLFWMYLRTQSRDLFKALRAIEYDLLLSNDDIDTPLEAYQKQAWEIFTEKSPPDTLAHAIDVKQRAEELATLKTALLL